MSSEGGVLKEPGKAAAKGEAFKEKDVLGASQKKHAYISESKKVQRKEVFSMLSGFKQKWVKGLLGVFKRLLG